jgi:membrane-associated phospholipid phosphatase
VSRSASVRWLVIATVAVVDAVDLRRVGIRLAADGLARLALAIFVLLVLALIYGHLRPRERLADLAQTAAQLLLLFAAAAVLSYALTVEALPLQDDLFAHADALLGFDWLAWFHAVEAKPLLRNVLHFAYITATPQLVAIAIYLALTGQGARNAELIWTLAIALIVIIPLSALLPGAGAFVRYDALALVDAPFVPEFAMLRHGALTTIDLNQVQGVITFPSFHTTLAILYPYVVRGNRRVFVGCAFLNLVMLLSIPSEGGHYLVDVFAGALVAVVAIRAAAWVEQRLSAPMPRGALSPAE